MCCTHSQKGFVHLVNTSDHSKYLGMLAYLKSKAVGTQQLWENHKASQAKTSKNGALLVTIWTYLNPPNRRTIHGVNSASLIRAACHLGASHKCFLRNSGRKLRNLRIYVGSKLIEVVNRIRLRSWTIPKVDWNDFPGWFVPEYVQVYFVHLPKDWN